MSILAGSRYNDENSTSVVRVPDASGVYQQTVLRTVPLVQTSYSLYVWQTGIRPDIAASEALNDPLLWWAIFDVNPEILDPLNVPAGTLVRIPRAPLQGQGTQIQ
jgi:hypothetical protein